MRLFFVLLVFAVSLLADGVLLYGFIPPKLDKKKIEQKLYTIRKTLDSTSIPATSDTVKIIFYKKSEQRVHGIRLPEWGGGGAIGKDSIVLPVDVASVFYENNLEQIIAHELVHIAIARMYGNVRVPRWFHEGLAMTLSGEVSFDEQMVLARAIVTRSLIPFDSIEHVNRFSRYKATLAYSQSHAVVSFLIGRYGTDLIPELLAASRQTRYFERACVDVFGLTMKEIEAQFIKDAQDRYPLLMMTTDFSLFWLFIIFLSVIAFIVTMIRKNKRKNEMAAEEIAEETAEGGEQDPLPVEPTDSPEKTA